MKKTGLKPDKNTPWTTYSEKKDYVDLNVLWMDHQRITEQALYREVPGYKRGAGSPRINWKSIVKLDL